MIWFTAIIIFIFAVGLFLLFAIPYSQAYQVYSEVFNANRGIGATLASLPQLRNYFMADNSYFWVSSTTISKLAQVTSETLGFVQEKEMFIGIGAFITIVYAICSKTFISNHLLSRNLLTAIAIMVLVTLGLGNVPYSLYWPFASFHSIAAVRVVSREILVLVFPVSIVVGQVINELRYFHFKLVNTSPIVLALCFLILADSVFAVKYVSNRNEWESRITNFEAKIHVPVNKDSIIVAAVSDVPWRDNLDAMLYAQTKGIKTMNGYSGNTPLGYVDMKTCADVAKNIASAEKFYQETLKQPFKLDRKKMIFVGFNSECFL